MEPGTVIAERFVLLELAGTGGMGTVWLARDLRDGSHVAVKRLRSARTHEARFVREAGILAALQHPGIVRYIDHGAEPDGSSYLAMEWLSGEDLAHHRGRVGRLSLRDAAALVWRVARALGAAHRAGIVHRDVKPANVFLADGRYDRPKLLDFGVAHVADSDPGGAGLGTVGYMAPEQIGGHAEVTPRADVFGLGCVAYECMVGEPAFAGATPVAVLAKVLLEDPPPLSEQLSGVPAALDTLVSRMLAKEPEDRPEDGVAVAEALSRILDHLDPDRTREGPARAPRATSLRPQPLSTEIRIDGALDLASARAQAERAVPTARWDARETEHGGLVLRPSGRDVVERARSAARAALALLRAEPRLAVVLCTDAPGAGAAPPPEPGAVRASPATVELLAGFDVSGARVLRERVIVPLGVSERERAPFVGRAREAGMLRAIAEGVFAEREPAAAVVVGEAGVGKTRLVRELLRELGTPATDYSLWVCRGDATRASAPWSLAADGLSRQLGLRGGESAQVMRERLSAAVAAMLPETEVARVSDFLGELIGLESASARVEQARQDAGELRRAIHRSVTELARAASRALPLVVVLDDLHWGDASSAALFADVLVADSESPILIVATAEPAVDLRFPALFAGAYVQRIAVPALSERPSRELAHALVPDASAEQLDAIVERAEGNPFLLDGLARVSSEGGALPVGVRATVEQRIGALAPEAQEVLMAASVFGGPFWVAGLRRLVSRPVAEELDAWLGILRDAGLVHERPESRHGGDRELELDHRLMREVAYDMLAPESRAEAHHEIVRFLEETGEPRAAVIAQHAERAGHARRAASAWLRAAEQAYDAYDGPTCIELVGRAEALGLDDADRGRARLLHAAALAWTGETALSEEKAREAMELLPRHGPDWYDATKHLLLAAFRGGHHQELVPVARLLIAGLRDPDPRPAAKAILTWSMAFLLGGQYELGQELFAELEATTDLSADPALAGRASAVRAFIAHRAGDVLGYVRWAETTVRALSREGEERSACVRLSNLAVALRNAGRLDDARDVVTTALHTAERLGARAQAATLRHNAAVIALERGELDDAIALGTRAVEELSRSGARRVEALARMELARALLETRDLDQAAEQAKTAAAVAADVPVLSPYAHAILARVLLERGEHGEADRLATVAKKRLDALGFIPEGRVFVALTAAEVSHARGRVSEAHAQLRAIRDDIAAIAARIPDQGERSRYLTALSTHRRVLQLAEAWRLT